jgi:hypothetical protein
VGDGVTDRGAGLPHSAHLVELAALMSLSISLDTVASETPRVFAAIRPNPRGNPPAAMANFASSARLSVALSRLHEL